MHTTQSTIACSGCCSVISLTSDFCVNLSMDVLILVSLFTAFFCELLLCGIQDGLFGKEKINCSFFLDCLEWHSEKHSWWRDAGALRCSTLIWLSCVKSRRERHPVLIEDRYRYFVCAELSHWGAGWLYIKHQRCKPFCFYFNFRFWKKCFELCSIWLWA